jgi:hypothetical protein
MSELNLKRTAVIVISQVLGFIIGYLIITVGFDLLQYVSSVQTSQSRTIAEYGIQYFLVTSIPIGLTIMIWMDALLDTGILPD